MDSDNRQPRHVGRTHLATGISHRPHRSCGGVGLLVKFRHLSAGSRVIEDKPCPGENAVTGDWWFGLITAFGACLTLWLFVDRHHSR